MNKTREDTLFALRYAVRVLERNARFWAIVSGTFKFLTVLSGTMALGALTAENKGLAVALGIGFAVMQALDVTLDPSCKKAESQALRREYAKVLANQAHHQDAQALEAAYQAVVADDPIVVMGALREIAFNDVVQEQGLDTASCFADHKLLRALS